MGVDPSHAGRVAVVTGASRGIGQAICRRLAERGATVVGVDILEMSETASVVQASAGRWIGIEADLATSECGELVASELERADVRCDILVNNAGINDAGGWDDLDIETWQRVLGVNLEAPFRLCKSLVPHMRARGWGRIVNVASGSVLRAMPSSIAYRASKMGLIGLTRALAAELGSQGITVNAMSPGVTITDMATQTHTIEFLEAAAQTRPIPRAGVPDDVVGVVLFLTSDDAAWVTGQTILANGGSAFV